MIFRDIVKKPAQDKKRDPKEISLVFKDKQPDRQTQRITGLIFIFVTACLALLIINLINMGNTGLALKKSITDAASTGFETILKGGNAIAASDFEKAKDLFAQAQEIFAGIQNDTWFIAPKTQMFKMNDPVFDAANALILTGRYIAQAGGIFAQAASRLHVIPRSFLIENQKAYDASMPSLTAKIKEQLPLFEKAADSLMKANEQIKKIPDSFVPAKLKERFNFAKEALASLSEAITGLKADMPAILALLGDKEPHSYLILLQNNAELRPTGGFIGNFILAETNDGYLVKNRISDIYSADHQLQEVLPPPDEILPANTRWFMRDSNYSAHFPLSAQKAAWFLEKEGGPGVDTVIAVDLSVVGDILNLTGPIKIPELSQPLTSGNFATVLSYIVESKMSGREDPKAILKSFVPAFQKAVFGHVDPVSLMPVLQSAAESKHIMAYSKNEDVQAFFEKQGMAGLMAKTGPREDYLNVVHTSISGNKSDAYVSETIAHDTYLRSDGRVTDEVTITRIHEWDDSAQRRLSSLAQTFGLPDASPKLLKILGQEANLQALRIYVPAGSTLENSPYNDVKLKFDEETGKTYFSAKMYTAPGRMKELKIRYLLPFRLNLDPVDKYLLTVQKQAGQENITIKKRILPDSGVLNYKYFPQNSAFDADGVWKFEGPLTRDMTFSSVWGK
ncbi:DUF4012 domain-containing protein [Candidatus Peregrinibacteria bacterium]|nr:DUF4012 domain-containing protein [Candidatus Peregrinibacteria bacterium]